MDGDALLSRVPGLLDLLERRGEVWEVKPRVGIGKVAPLVAKLWEAASPQARRRWLRSSLLRAFGYLYEANGAFSRQGEPEPISRELWEALAKAVNPEPSD
jgi:hypothetical protein